MSFDARVNSVTNSLTRRVYCRLMISRLMFLFMSILVTGATGRVGSRFVRRLVAEGEPVRVLVRGGEVAGAQTVVGDLRDADDRRRALDAVDAVVHLAAAFRGVPDEEAIAVNHEATVALARAAG